MSSPRKPLIVVGAADPNSPAFSQLNQWGYDVRSAGTLPDVLQVLDKEEPSAVLIEDRIMGELNGHGVEELTSRRPQVPVILLTDDADNAASSFDAIPRPLVSERLQRALARATEQHRLWERVATLERELDDDVVSRMIVGSSDAMTNVRDSVRALASTSLHVAIVGERGTGRELVARALHAAGKRKNGPFVPVHADAIPESAVDRVLFGLETRSISAADIEPTGACVAAEGGTLYITGLASMALTTQAKLARFLKEAMVNGASGDRVKPLDARVVLGLEHDPADEREAGRLHHDLVERLQAATIAIAPLRDRVEDIAPLAMHFLRDFATFYGKVVEGWEPGAMAKLEAHRWPGNVAELRSFIHRLVASGTNSLIGADAIHQELSARHEGNGKAPGGPCDVSPIIDLSRTRKMDDIERQAILFALQKTRGNVVEAARVLGLGPATVYRKIKRYGVRAKTIASS